ncbi:MAG: hypothetical protein R2759_12185 [Bacteroidales bacterium]
MKKAFFTIALAAFTIFSLSAQVSTEKNKEERKPTPEEKLKWIRKSSNKEILIRMLR